MLGFFVRIKPHLGFKVKSTFEYTIWFFFIPFMEWGDRSFFMSNGKAVWGRVVVRTRGTGKASTSLVAQHCWFCVHVVGLSTVWFNQ